MREDAVAGGAVHGVGVGGSGRRVVEQAGGNRAGELGVNVDFACFEGFVEKTGFAEIGLGFYGQVGVRFNQDFVHLDQDFRLGAEFARHNQRGFGAFRLPLRRKRGGKGGNQRGQHPHAVAQADGFELFEQIVEREGKGGGRNGADKNQAAVVAVDAQQDKAAEPARADKGGQRGRADNHHGGGADARHNHRQRQRQLEFFQPLPARHAEGGGGFAQIGVDLV